jgi:hypothetical protein
MYRFAAAILVVASATAGVDAYEFRVRFVERVGPAFGGTDSELVNNTIDASNGGPRRIRVQFGVFDDGEGPAPAGGYLGWNVGTIAVSGGAGNSDEFRNSALGVPNGVGRLSPFNFAASANGANGVPAADPFDSLARIDNTLGHQDLVWESYPSPPQPAPIIRGLNTFVSTYEITIDPSVNAQSYTIDFAGNLLAAVEWRFVALFVIDDAPAVVTYAPLPTPPREFSATLHVLVPAPVTVPLLPLLRVLSGRRRGRSFP